MSAILLLGCGIVVVLASILWLRLHAFLALILAAYSVALFTPADTLRHYAAARKNRGEMTEKAAGQFPKKAAATRVAEEFGKTCANLGVLIAMAAILSEAMLLSGAAESIAATLLRVLGAARAHWAFFSASFLLCIPVMLDTIFYLLSPLMKAVARRTNRDYLLLVMCTVAGGTITHSLVPPTPGPLFVALELGVPLGMMIGMGTAIGLGAALSGVLFAHWSNRRHVLAVPADETPPIEGAATGPVLPSFWLSLLPVIAPIVLIGVDAAISPGLDASSWQGWLVRTFGDKDMALTIGAIIALLILARRRTTAQASSAVGTAIGSGAAIVLIIAAGGAFGGVLRQTGIADVLGTALAAQQSFVLPALFLITTLVRTAQGSATVAMITAAPIARALIESGQAHIHPVYMAIAIGCGSKPFPWMNDAGFWIITRLSGLREEQTLRTVSPMMSLQGVVGLILTMLAAWLFPMQ